MVHDRINLDIFSEGDLSVIFFCKPKRPKAVKNDCSGQPGAGKKGMVLQESLLSHLIARDSKS